MTWSQRLAPWKAWLRSWAWSRLGVDRRSCERLSAADERFLEAEHDIEARLSALAPEIEYWRGRLDSHATDHRF